MSSIKMKTKILGIIGGLIIFLIPEKVWAGDFSIGFSSTYEIATGADTIVTHQISITNQTANVYVSEYTVKVGGTNVSDVKAYNAGGTFPVVINPEQNSTTISVNLANQPVVGKEKMNQFTLQYRNNDAATIVGNVLELNIPKIANLEQFESYELTIIVPRLFGAPQTIVPNTDSFYETTKNTIIKFNRGQLNSGVTAIFGDSQFFKADINYYLDNPSTAKVIKTIALIPDKGSQRVSYTSLEPSPLKIHTDQDGNWLADYEIEPQKNLNISLAAMVETFIDQKIPVTESDPNLYLGASEYWQTDNEQIQKLAQELKTPRAIYDFVVEKLEYNYQLTENGNERAGAVRALQEPENAICTEFTDLFVALARAAGIPAREINGFAYTKNPKLRPLSLSRDVLHSWPEYWDSEQKKWIQIDPTWGNTTGSIDYFKKLDLNHITFVTHGIYSDLPVPAGFYKTDTNRGKTVFIEPTNIQPPAKPQLELKVQLPDKFPTFRYSNISISIGNGGNQAIYDLPLSTDTAYITANSIPSKLNVLLPGQTLNWELKVKPKDLWSRKIDRLTVEAGDQAQTYYTESYPVSNFWPAVLIPAALGLIMAVIFSYKSRHIRLHGPKQK